MIERIEARGFLICGLSSLLALAACSSGSDGSATGAGGAAGNGMVGPSAGGAATSGGGVPAMGAGGTAQGTGNTSTTSTGGTPQGAGGAPTTGSGGTTTSTGGVPTTSDGGATSTGGASSTGGATSTGGASSTGGAGGAVATGGPCLTDLTTEAAIIGDSYITGFLTPALQPSLAMLDPSLTNTPNYGVAGVSLANGGLNANEDVPIQFATAIKAHSNLKFTIMDGGGNDILVCDGTKFPGCATNCAKAGSSTNAVCQSIVQQSIDAASKLLQTAATAGVQNTVYFFYPHTPDMMGGFNEILDYAEPKAKAACDGAYAASGNKLSCFFVDLVAPFKAAFGDANPADFETALGVHPTQPGVTLMAQQIFDTMKAHCVGFTASDAMKYGCTCTK
ncbi:MAG TPA: SGNH/GDSL hydrolase family protein [Polyangiaceae bacterium]|nr:SGNH/GDSL hydrolase family protein [Polyangiaceae bacterium]